MQSRFLNITVSLIYLCGLLPLPQGGATVSAQTIPSSLYARIIQLEDERNLNGDELTKLLKHSATQLRARAALAIGRIGDKRGTAALLALLQTEQDDAVRHDAAFALGEIEDAQAVPALLEFLTADKYPLAVRARFVEALGKIASIPANVEALGQAVVAQINERLIEQLPAPPAALTAEQNLLVSLTITALMRLRATAAVAPLAGQMKADDAGIRAQAANALARLRQPLNEAVSDLIAALQDPEANVRANAARALGGSKDARAVEPLLELLADENAQVQANAIRALAALNDQRAVEPLLQLGGSLVKRAQTNLLLETFTALGALKDERALPFLRELREEYETGAHPELEIAVARFGEDAYFSAGDKLLLKAPGAPRHYANVAQGLAAVNSELSKELLLMLWMAVVSQEPAPAEILQALAKLKPKILPSLLREALLYKDVIVRATAADLLADLNEDKNLPALVAGWAAADKDKTNDAKLAILTALAEYQSLPAVEVVKTALTDQDHLVRRHAVDLLQQMGAGDFSERIGIVQTKHNQLFYQRVVARLNKKVTATIHTNKGSIVLELFPQDAPLTVDNFITLARRGFYNNLTFHRVVPNFVIQGGDPRGDGEGGPGHQIRCEINGRPYTRGAVGMALSGKDTGGSQFFITHSPQPHLDGGYTLFGQVTSGLEVVDKIVRGDVIKRVVIVEAISLR